MTYSIRSILKRTAISLLLLSALPAANANCFINDRGEEICNNGLSQAIRVGIAIGILVLVLLIILALGFYRRRRMQRANQAYITNPNTAPYQPYPAPGYNYDQNGYNPQEPPQYPPQSYAPPYAPPQEYNGAQEYNAQPYSHPYPTQYPPNQKA